MATKATTETSAALTQTVETLMLQMMRVREISNRFQAPIAALAAVVIYSQTEQALSLLWIIKETHAGVGLLCVASACAGSIIARRKA
jgi:hypothetical protein